MSYFSFQDHQIFYAQLGVGEPLLLLHGNTASSQMFEPVIKRLAQDYHVVVIDFLGNGQSDRLEVWPCDLWFQWGEQVQALCHFLGLSDVSVIGCSGGALAALNLALEHPNTIKAVIADSFAGLKADQYSVKQLKTNRDYAKQNNQFCALMKTMHGKDWEAVIEADTQAIISHATNIGNYCHHALTELTVPLLLTGSEEDEMFPAKHYKKLFDKICRQTGLASKYIFAHGHHPAMLSNIEEFIFISQKFFQ